MAADRQLDFWASGIFWGSFQSFSQTDNFYALVFFGFFLRFFIVVIKNNVYGKCTSVSPCCICFKLGKCESNTLNSASPFETFVYSCEIWGKNKTEKSQSHTLKTCFCGAAHSGLWLYLTVNSYLLTSKGQQFPVTLDLFLCSFLDLCLLVGYTTCRGS